MSFTSIVFLLVFFPLCMVGNVLLSERWRNTFLCLMSMVFYAWCGIHYLLLLMLSATLAYAFGLWIEKAGEGGAKRRILCLALAFYLGILFGCKYLFDFFPLGISFYTFSILSYLLDVYWEKCKAQKQIVHVWLYILFFPKLIQGPIMRYTAFEAQLNHREVSLDAFNQGFTRMIKGMVKKVMIADRIDVFVSYSFTNVGQIGTLAAWTGIFAYLLQLYYDFSGYTDIAVGLGQMAGFILPENFDHPYLSSSVSEYWRRWHITLGEWFRDYVYMPVSRFLMEWKPLHKLNNPMLACDLLSLFAVWTLTGIWHGSGLKYFAWGMWYFGFIAFERIRDFYRKKKRRKQREKAKKKLTPLQKLGDRLLFAVAVIFGQVIFRAGSLAEAFAYWGKMLLPTRGDGWYFLYSFTNYRAAALAAGIVFCFPLYRYLEKKISGNEAAWLLYRAVLLLAGCVAFSFAAGAGYSAFLYEVF